MDGTGEVGGLELIDGTDLIDALDLLDTDFPSLAAGLYPSRQSNSGIWKYVGESYPLFHHIDRQRWHDLRGACRVYDAYRVGYHSTLLLTPTWRWKWLFDTMRKDNGELSLSNVGFLVI